MIHPPWQRIHLVMYILTVAVALMVASLYVPFVGYGPGVAVVTAMAIVGLAIYWTAYVGHQRSVEIRGGQLIIRSWLRWWRFGTDRSIDLDTVTSALLLRPHHVELAIPGASTRVRTLYATKQGVDRFGTFWWHHDDYRALRDALLALGIETEYRQNAGLAKIITAR